MNNNEPNISLYGDGSNEEFPVLKAFQQYIDAEQEKARRRLLTVSIVFVFTLIAVIGIFSVMVIKANDRTQSLNNQMVELLIKEKDRTAVDAKAAAIQEHTVKNLNETLERLQKQIEEQDRKAAEAAAAAAKELAAVKAAAAAKATVEEPKADGRTLEAEERIQKALALLKSEKQKLADEKKKLREQELERYRREHYPEYYAKKDAAAKKRTQLDTEFYDEDEDGVSYFDEEDEDDPKPVKKPAKKSGAADRTVNLDDEDEAIEYFKDADTYTIPVEVKGKRAGWRVPLD